MAVNVLIVPLEIHVIYLGYMEIYCIFKRCCIIFVMVSQNAIYFIILSFSLQVICFL